MLCTCLHVPIDHRGQLKEDACLCRVDRIFMKNCDVLPSLHYVHIGNTFLLHYSLSMYSLSNFTFCFYFFCSQQYFNTRIYIVLDVTHFFTQETEHYDLPSELSIDMDKKSSRDIKRVLMLTPFEGSSTCVVMESYHFPYRMITAQLASIVEFVIAKLEQPTRLHA